MKEIIYIQAGELSNYAGTHFWNAQESYIPYDDAEDTNIETSISFCESVDAQERSTLYPRLLMFDKKSNFGTLASNEEEDVDAPVLWTGGLVEHRQEQIPKSSYQNFMDEEQSQDDREMEDSRPSNKDLLPDACDIRYWSDFSRVYYLPRSLQKLQDPPDWETSSLDWNEGQEIFKRFNEESEVMDGALRLFAEDCDNLQGVQIMNDTDTFGSFMSTFFASFRDEYLKLPSFVLPIVSGVLSHNPDCDDVKSTRMVLSEAFYLRTLNEFSSMNILIEEPTSWPDSVWGDSLRFPSGSIYHQSAVLSAHVETCTLPFRLKQRQREISSICAQLNWRNAAPFGELGGVFPFSGLSDLDNKVVNFSANLPLKSSNLYAQMDVTRGFSSADLQAYDRWSTARRSTNIIYTASVHEPAYPLPSSFPTFKQEATTVQIKNGLHGTNMYSSLSTSDNIAKRLERYAIFVDKCVKRRTTSMISIGVSMDELKELAHDLWTMHDNSEQYEFEM